MASVEEVAAGLRAMGYSEGQARALAGDPQGEPGRVVGRRFAGTPARAPSPSRPRKSRAPRVAVGGDGDRFTAGARWGIQRKAVVIELVRSGLVSLATLTSRYGVTAEEFQHWCTAFDAAGLRGLRATKREADAMADGMRA